MSTIRVRPRHVSCFAARAGKHVLTRGAVMHRHALAAAAILSAFTLVVRHATHAVAEAARDPSAVTRGARTIRQCGRETPAPARRCPVCIVTSGHILRWPRLFSSHLKGSAKASDRASI